MCSQRSLDVNETAPARNPITFTARDGHIDLSAAAKSDFAQGIILHGTWEFIPHRLLTPGEYSLVTDSEITHIRVPGHWDQAFAPKLDGLSDSLRETWRNAGTYRLRIQLPEPARTDSRVPLALRIANVHTSYRLYINGELRQTIGQPGLTPETTVPQFQPIVIPLALATQSARQVEIVIQVAGFHHRNGGLWKPPELGDYEILAHGFAAQISAEWVEFGLYSGMAVLFLFLFVGGKRHTELLIFATLSGIIAIRSILTQNRAAIQLWPDFDFSWNYSLEYLTFVLIPPIFAYLFYTLFPGEKHSRPFRAARWWVYGLIFVGLTLSAIVIATPARIYTHVFAVGLLQILSAAALMLYLLILAVRRGETEAKLLLIGTIIVFVATLNDDLHNRNIIQSVYMATTAFAFFLLFVAGLLGFRVRRVEQERESAEARYRARSEFFSMMSHELRTPLHALLGMVQLMEETDLPQPQQREYMRIMRGGGESLLALVNDILDLSRVEAGKMEFRQESIELQPFIQDTVEAFRGQAGQKRLPIIVNQDDRLPEYILGDAFRIRQVIANLVGNALKFTAQGHIELQCNPVAPAEMIASDQQPRIEFAVVDTGAGIPIENQKTIFESFRQAETAQENPGDASGKSIAGTGLGLAICRQLVEGMCGEIGVTSTVGQGSRFWFRLPLRPAPTAGSISDESAAAKAEPGEEENRFHFATSILLADDDEISRMLLERFLFSYASDSHAKISIDSVENGRLAFEKFQDQTPGHYDIVLLDMQMPEMSGIETIQAIRKLEMENSLQRTPAIVVTANAMETDVERTRLAGFDDFVAKPVKKDELRRVLISTLLANRKGVIA